MDNVGFPASPDFTKSLADADAKIRHLDIDLTIARDNVRFNLSGNMLFVDQVAYDAETTISTTLTVGTSFYRRNQSDNDAVRLTGGTLYQLGNFSSLFITNTAQPNSMMRLYYSSGPVIQPFASEVTIIGDIGTVLTTGAVAVTNAAGGILVRGANANRKALTIENMSAAIITIGGAGITTATGLTLASSGAGLAGGSYTTTTYSGLIRAIAPTAGPHDIRFQEEST